MTALQDDPASKGKKLAVASVGSNPIVLRLSGFSSSDDSFGDSLFSPKIVLLLGGVLFRVVSLRGRGEYR